MASFLKGFDEYWQNAANTCQKLIAPRIKSKAVILQYVPKIIIEKPAKKDISATPELIEERICVLIDDSKLPPPWAEAVVKLQAMSRPLIIPPNSWQDIQFAGNQLYRDNFGLLKLIISYEWSLHDIYGCNLKAPMFRFDEMGLLLLLHQGDEVVEVNAERIKILHKSGSITCLKKRQVKPTEENLLFNCC